MEQVFLVISYVTVTALYSTSVYRQTSEYSHPRTDKHEHMYGRSRTHNRTSWARVTAMAQVGG